MLSPFSPPGAQPPTHDSKTWYSASWVDSGRPSRRAVSRATSHTPVSVRRPHSSSRERRTPSPARPRAAAIPRVSSGRNVATMSSGSARLVAGDGTVEGDVVAERGRRLVGDGHAADVHQQGGVEGVAHLVVVQIGAPGQRRSDQARAHRHARRQPEPRSATIDRPPRRSASRRIPTRATVEASDFAKHRADRGHPPPAGQKAATAKTGERYLAVEPLAVEHVNQPQARRSRRHHLR